MQYNLIRNGYFTSLTTSGTGNIDLSWSELEYLMDGNLTSSGISVSASGVLYLETNLSQRVKVDGIRLYTSDLSKSANIKFYYKNTESDSYTILTTQSGASYYYTTIPTPSAPQFIRATISGAGMDVYEFQVFNDDYIVAFGQDGSQYAEYLDNTPVGEIGAGESIAIYNNSTSSMSANAYTCVDYTGNEADYYIEIADNENGPFYDLIDGVILEDNDPTSTYLWDMGDFSNTEILNNSVIMSNVDAVVDSRLGDLPLIDASQSWNVGMSAWVYDKARNYVYAIGTDATVTTLKLYKYDISTNVWTYMWEINPGITGFADKAVMTLVGDYVYVICNGDAAPGFGRSDITASGINWQSLSSPVFSSGQEYDITGDGVRYLYTAIRKSSSSYTDFKRYDTVSGTWSNLNSGYTPYQNTAGYNYSMSLTCNNDSGFVYMWYAGTHIQRYNIAGDSWNQNYIAPADVGGVASNGTLYYYKNRIFIFSSVMPHTVYIYNILTDVISYIDVYIPTIIHAAANAPAYLLPIEPQSNEYDVSMLLSNIDGDRGSYYMYNNNLHITDHKSGTYTTPIFGLDYSSKASYFTDDNTTVSGFDSISYDENTYNGTIRIKSSDTKPITVNKIFWCNSGGAYIDSHDVYTNTTITDDILIGSHYYGRNIAVNRRNGRIAVGGYYSYYSTYRMSVFIYDKDYNSIDNYSNANMYYLEHSLDFDNDNGIWAYGEIGLHLVRINNNYDDLSCDITTGSDFLYDFAVEWDGTGLWYTDQDDNAIKHIDHDGTLINSALLNSPRGVCATSDNGCWVSDDAESKIYRYSETGSLIDTIEYTTLDISSVTRMVKDFDNGFWFFNSDGVGHINDNNQKDLFIESLNIDRIRAGHKCCIIFSYTNDDIKFVDLEVGAVTFHWTTSSTNSRTPGLMSFSYDDYKNYQDLNHIIPASYDPVWGTTGTAEWKEVRKDGYFLPKYRYHQVEYTLRSNYAGYNPALNKIILAPAVEISDIQPNNYKNMYIRTNIPLGADITDYEARIKTWWGENE